MGKKFQSRDTRRSKEKYSRSKEKLASGENSDTRLNRYIARAGVCSRRKADELIEQGLVKVNGMIVNELGGRVNENDVVEVNGKIISPQQHIYLLLNKPGDTITTTSDERGRKTVLDLVNIPDDVKAGLFPVGRLDRNTLGVLLLTNDGELAHRLMHPRYEVTKIYRVRTNDPVEPDQINKLRRGVQLDDGLAKAEQVEYTDPLEPTEIVLMLHEGRNHQVRRMMESLGHEVKSLERINYAGLTTKGVRRGKWRRLYSHEIRRLRNQVKL